uniref:hypothetical protein n=1 Tax=Nocardia abscessus TaxID=120957 RepID=UPI002458D5F7
DLERELGLVGGNVMHVEMSLDQMMLWRPLPELAGQRVPGAPGLPRGVRGGGPLATPAFRLLFWGRSRVGRQWPCLPLAAS